MHPELIKVTELLGLNSPERFEEALKLLRRTVYCFSLKFSRHPADAEDTTQEVMIRALRHLGRFQDPHSLAAWLYVVTRNRYRCMHRKHAHDTLKVIPLDGLTIAQEKAISLIADTRKSPEVTLLQAEQSRLLHQAIRRIPAPLRIVLVLHDMEEFTTAEVAEILALKQGTIRVRLHRARLCARKETDVLLAERRLESGPHNGIKTWCSCSGRPTISP
ncbi:MAG TPA: RNA polymerase sigma factor [Terracidiphilus sp.]|nr:RNA polymerase sigma factor [Terracidiphilus sp.]